MRLKTCFNCDGHRVRMRATPLLLPAPCCCCVNKDEDVGVGTSVGMGMRAAGWAWRRTLPADVFRPDERMNNNSRRRHRDDLCQKQAEERFTLSSSAQHGADLPRADLQCERVHTQGSQGFQGSSGSQGSTSSIVFQSTT